MRELEERDRSDCHEDVSNGQFIRRCTCNLIRTEHHHLLSHIRVCVRRERQRERKREGERKREKEREREREREREIRIYTHHREARKKK
jgi:hypothetical protein